jgi:hypothetical protein
MKTMRLALVAALLVGCSSTEGAAMRRSQGDAAAVDAELTDLGADGGDPELASVAGDGGPDGAPCFSDVDCANGCCNVGGNFSKVGVCAPIAACQMQETVGGVRGTYVACYANADCLTDCCVGQPICTSCGNERAVCVLSKFCGH